MSNISKVNLNEVRNVLAIVEQCCRELQIDFYIIGALATEIWFATEGLMTSGTKDVDFAVFVSEEHKFTQLKSALIDNHGFRESKGNSFVLFAPDKTQIDILPFGSLEVEDGITVPGRSLTRIKVNGFKEVYLESVREVKVLDDRLYKVATLPGIFLLKLIAYDDRPEQRRKDPLDCMAIIQRHFNLQRELIYNHHHDLFIDDTPLTNIAARVIGREMRKPLLENAQLMSRVVDILENHIRLASDSSFVGQMALAALEGNEYMVHDCISYLTDILTGIKGER